MRLQYEWDIAELKKQLKWSEFLVEHLGGAYGILMVLGFFAMLLLLPVIAVANQIIDTETGPTIAVLALVAYAVWVVWSMAQARLRLQMKVEELERKMRDLPT